METGALQAMPELPEPPPPGTQASTPCAPKFLTALVRGGANLEAVRELAGHSKLHTTQRYVHATGADLRDAIGRLPGN